MDRYWKIKIQLAASFTTTATHHNYFLINAPYPIAESYLKELNRVGPNALKIKFSFIMENRLLRSGFSTPFIVRMVEAESWKLEGVFT